MFSKTKIRNFGVLHPHLSTSFMMNELKDLLRIDLWGNSLANYVWFFSILLVAFLLKDVFARIIYQTLFYFSNNGGVTLADSRKQLRKPLSFFFFLLAVYFAFHRLVFPPELNFTTIDNFGLRLILARTFQCFLIGSVSWILIRVVKYFALIFKHKATLSESKIDDQLVPFFKDLGIVAVIITTGFVMLGRVFNIDVVALITGLGIGGLAIALAARETLENLFASFTIFLDMPFTVGDAVQVDKISGEIEKIGFRSTRIRTVEGSLVTIPNRLMTSQALDNLTKRDYRRVRYILKINLNTPVDKLKGVINEIQKVVDEQETTNQKQSGIRLEGFSENAIEVLVIYYIQTQDYWEALKIKEQINFRIMRILEENDVHFASPALNYPQSTN